MLMMKVSQMIIIILPKIFGILSISDQWVSIIIYTSCLTYYSWQMYLRTFGRHAFVLQIRSLSLLHIPWTIMGCHAKDDRYTTGTHDRY